MEVKKLFIDMDGVLADFDRGVIELAGGSEPGNADNRPAAHDEDMWDRIRKVDHFYGNLEMMDGAKKLFDTIYERLGDKCEILTGIPKPHRKIAHSAEDKTEWIHRLLSEDVKVNVVYKEDKPDYCTGKDCILIDDLESNIKKWEACGGTGILHKNVEETLKKLREIGVI